MRLQRSFLLFFITALYCFIIPAFMHHFFQYLALAVPALLTITHSLACRADDHALMQCLMLPDRHLKLVWSDEFDGDSLNTADWTYKQRPSGWVKHELQNYVRDRDVVTVSDGTLKISHSIPFSIWPGEATGAA